MPVFPTIDFAAHNAEVAEVMAAYRARKPIRVPVILGINVRYTMFNPEVNRRGVNFEQYTNDPQIMLERQLEHTDWIRRHVPQDAEMGPPADGWGVSVDFQNFYEAAWLGAPVRFYPDQVPDTEPLLCREDRKNLLFDRGLPDPFRDGLMRRNWEYYDYFKRKQAEGWTYQGRPLAHVNPSALGTDGPLTVACNLRGATEFLTDLLEDTSYALALMDYITTAAIQRIRAYRQKLGLPEKYSFGLADDSVQLISTAMYAKLILPFHRRLVEAFSDGGPLRIHLCGDASRHFVFLRDELNIQAFDTGFPIDFAQVRAQLGPDVEIAGGPKVPFLEQATPVQVREEVRRILGSGIMAGGRFILREGNNLPPGVPLENVWAMYEAGKEFGRYS